MLRSVTTRNCFIKTTIRKAVRTNFVRSLSAECRKKPHRTLLRTNFPKWQWQDTAPSLVRNYSSSLPPHTKVTLPALSPTMEMGTIISWEKKEGDRLNEGDLLAEVETDKATMGFETPEEGFLAKILIAAGTKDIPVGKLVCIIVEKQEDVANFKDFKDDGAAPAPKAAAPAPAAPLPPPPAPAAVTPAPTPPPIQPTPSDGGRVYASPMAKRLAEQQQIRLQGKGTGLYGSITSSDLQSMPQAAAVAPAKDAAKAPKVAPAPPPGGFVDIPISNMRNVIAKRLLEAHQKIPVFFLTAHANVDKLLALRTRMNKKLEKAKIKLSVNDFLIKAIASAAKKVPDVNATWKDTVIRQYSNVDVSVAVSTETGLITPIVFNADSIGVTEISKKTKELAEKARNNKLQPHEFQGGTISISNLGMFGTDEFIAIINPPQSVIVAVGTNVKKLIPAKNEKGFQESDFISVSLSCDHRVVDGAVAARFLAALKEHMEDPESMIL